MIGSQHSSCMHTDGNPDRGLHGSGVIANGPMLTFLPLILTSCLCSSCMPRVSNTVV